MRKLLERAREAQAMRVATDPAADISQLDSERHRTAMGDRAAEDGDNAASDGARWQSSTRWSGLRR